MSATSDDDDCPICLERMPEDTWRGIERHRVLCCGKNICAPCSSLLQHRQTVHAADVRRAATDNHNPEEIQRQLRILEASLKCPMCRETLPSTDQEVFQRVQSRAEQHGWDWAQYKLGMCYLNGRGVNADPRQAVVWFKKAAAQGNYKQAEHELGEIYNFGKGVRKSPPEAARWYKKAADSGFALSQYALGNMLNNGEGVPRNRTEGARLLTLAAEQGVDAAQCALAYCYENGEGLEPSLEKSLYWNKKAADQGNVTAMANYGGNLLYAAAAKYQGSVEVVGHSPVPEALYWARKSVAAGNMDAQSLVDQLETAIGNVCANCQKRPVKLQKCSRCKAAMYCGAPCQKAHWKAGHKMDCVDETGHKKS
jgi:TPR repeat protein